MCCYTGDVAFRNESAEDAVNSTMVVIITITMTRNRLAKRTPRTVMDIDVCESQATTGQYTLDSPGHAPITGACELRRNHGVASTPIQSLTLPICSRPPRRAARRRARSTIR